MATTRKKAAKRASAPAKKRKGVSGSAKGSAFERLIAKQLSLWISKGNSQDLLWRSAGSGGRSTMRFKQTGKGIEFHASDLAPLHPDAGPFVDTFTVECKNYRAIELRQVVYDWTASLVAKWWAQATRDARSVNRIALLIVKENQKRSLIVLPDPIYGWLAQYAPALHTVHVRQGQVTFCDLEMFLALVPFKTFKGCYVPHRADDRPALDRPRRRRISLDGV